MMKQAVRSGCRFCFAQPRARQFLDLAGGQAEVPAKRANKGGLAAESKIGGKVDYAISARRRVNEPPQGPVQSLLLHVTQEPAIGFKQPIEACAGNAKATAKMIRREQVGLEIRIDVAFDHREMEMALGPPGIAFHRGRTADCGGDSVKRTGDLS